MTTDKYRVLLVEDDPSLLRLLSMRLTAAGYAVTAVDSGERALAQIPQLQPHLIITDLQMGGMNGMTLFNQVHRRDPSLPVLILTAHGTIPEAIKATGRGVYGYLTKPFDSRVLLGHVARALELGREKPARQSDAAMAGWREER
jgi:two-component system response regulator GlrR